MKADLGTANDTEVCGYPPEPDKRVGRRVAARSNQVSVSTTVTRLVPNTTYFFRACGQDTNDPNPSCAATLSFKTLAGTSYAFDRKWGSYGAGNGQFNTPVGVATDAPATSTSRTSGNNRIQKFAPRAASSPVGHARHGQRPVQRPLRRGHGRRRQRLRRRLEQQPHPEVQLDRHLPHQVGHARHRQRPVRRSPWACDRRRRQRLRRGLGQQPHPEVQLHRHLPHQVGQPAPATAVQHPSAWPRTPPATSTSRTRQQPHPEVQLHRAPTSPSGARAARATGSSTIPTAWRRTPPATSTSRTTATPDPEVQLHGRLHHPVGHLGHGQRPVPGPRAWPPTPPATSTSRTPTTTASRSSGQCSNRLAPIRAPRTRRSRTRARAPSLCSARKW